MLRKTAQPLRVVQITASKKLKPTDDAVADVERRQKSSQPLRAFSDPKVTCFFRALALPKFTAFAGGDKQIRDVLAGLATPLEGEFARLLLEFDARTRIEHDECSLLLGGLAMGFDVPVSKTRNDVAAAGARSGDDSSDPIRE